MAQTKSAKTLADVREEAKYPKLPRNGDYISPWDNASPGGGRIGTDGVLRRRIGRNRMQIERQPGREILRWERHNYQAMTTEIALYRGDPGAVKSVKRILYPTKPAKRSGVSPKKWKSGTVALREIRKYQGAEKNWARFGPDAKLPTNFSKDQTRLLIPKANFQRLVKELYRDLKSDLRITTKAMEALQTAAEQHLVDIYQDANLCCVMENGETQTKQTLMKRHMRLAGYIRRDPIPDGVSPRTDGVPPGNRQPSDYYLKYKEKYLG